MLKGWVVMKIFGRTHGALLVALSGLLLLTAAVTLQLDPGTSQMVDHATVLANWGDQLGPTVTNVAVLDFTAATSTSSTWFKPPNPVWLAGAAQFDGAWRPQGWQVATLAADNRGTLLLALNRNAAMNQVWLGLSVVSAVAAELYVDLLDTNALPVVVNLFGNLMDHDSVATNVLLSVPLANYPTATVIALRRNKGTLIVPLALLAISEYPATVTIPNGAAGSNASDSQTNCGVSQASASTPSTDPGLSLFTSGVLLQTNVAPPGNAVTWYVSSSGGRDSYSGRAMAWNGQHGPFATANKALRSAAAGDTIVILEGWYDESLNVSGRNIQLAIIGEVDFSHGNVSKKGKQKQ
jgi:hypothetical protein